MNQSLIRALTLTMALFAPVGTALAADAAQLREARQLTDPAEREPRLMQALASIDPREPLADELIAELRLLSGYQPQLLRPANPEHRVVLSQPAYPIATRARALLATATDARSARQLLAQWRRTSVLPKTATAPGAFAHLAELASPAEIAALAATRPDWPDAAMAVLAERSGDGALYRHWLTAARGPAALRALAGVPERLPAGTAFELLRDVAESNPGLASAATLRVAAVADPRRVDWLIGALDNADFGASAAQALAGLPASQWIDAIGHGRSDHGWRHRALALRWIGTPMARERLRIWQRDGALPATLKAEVASWSE